MDHSNFQDAFEQVRKDQGINQIDDQQDPVLMILRHKDVRKCAHDWKTFQSGARPGRIVVPSEVDIRDLRQIPFEVDPPQHGEYRKLVKDWFRRPLQAPYQALLAPIVEHIFDEMLKKDSFEVVSEFSLPLQSRALTLLLNVPFEEAETWISWGTHVFRSEETALDKEKANILYDYIDQQIDQAIANPGEDLYSVLLQSLFEGQQLSRDEVKGVMILTFAGGRDTVINILTNSISYFADHPEMIAWIRRDPSMVGKATEELVRYFSPLTHMGRVAIQDTEVCAHAVEADSRISLCWASANRDESVFERPNDVILDRKTNPHVAFGFSHHNCLGAHHTRQIMKQFLLTLAQKVSRIEIIHAEEKIEHWGDIDRKVGFEKLTVAFHPKP